MSTSHHINKPQSKKSPAFPPTPKQSHKVRGTSEDVVPPPREPEAAAQKEMSQRIAANNPQLAQDPAQHKTKSDVQGAAEKNKTVESEAPALNEEQAP